MFYDSVPEALPLVAVAPALHPHAPHIWSMVRNGQRLRTLCYTFAPDGTIVRGRGADDDGAEVLRQATMWLMRYMVWSHFGFWPGEEVAHDAATVERLTRPADPCPTHTWRTYGECCRPRVLAALRQAASMRDGIAPTARIA